MNKRQSPANGDSAVTLFGPGDYCALTLLLCDFQFAQVIVPYPETRGNIWNRKVKIKPDRFVGLDFYMC